jgi:hypothetical protein
MHELPTLFTQGHWLYTQVERHGDVALYRQSHQDVDVARYEVIRVRHHPARKLPMGRIAEAGEYYPTSSEWGQHGWTHFTLTEAQNQMLLFLGIVPPDMHAEKAIL